MNTYNITSLSEVTQDMQRNDGIIAHLRSKALSMIPKGHAASLSDVARIMADETGTKYQTIYNYVRSGCKNYLEKIDKKLFIINKTGVEDAEVATENKEQKLRTRPWTSLNRVL